MTNERMIVGRELARQMWGVEDSIDESIKRLGEMISQLPVARKRCRLSGTVGQEVFAGAASTLHMLVSARGEAFSLHNGMASLGEQVGITPVAIGSDWKLNERPKLAAVTDEAA